MKASEICTLVITSDNFAGVSSNKFIPEVYLDDNRYGLPPQTAIINAGEHTISLIPSSQIKFEEGKVRTSKIRIKQLYSTVLKQLFKANKKYSIHFIFNCASAKCNADDEWWFSTELK
jgi:hypothetical protein